MHHWDRVFPAIAWATLRAIQKHPGGVPPTALMDVRWGRALYGHGFVLMLGGNVVVTPIATEALEHFGIDEHGHVTRNSTDPRPAKWLEDGQGAEFRLPSSAVREQCSSHELHPDET